MGFPIDPSLNGWNPFVWSATSPTSALLAWTLWSPFWSSLLSKGRLSSHRASEDMVSPCDRWTGTHIYLEGFFPSFSIQLNGSGLAFCPKREKLVQRIGISPNCDSNSQTVHAEDFLGVWAHLNSHQTHKARENNRWQTVLQLDHLPTLLGLYKIIDI